MEIFGGFMAMMSMATLFLAIVWLIMPFVVFAIKGKQERTLELLEEMRGQLSTLQKQVDAIKIDQGRKQENVNNCEQSMADQ